MSRIPNRFQLRPRLGVRRLQDKLKESPRPQHAGNSQHTPKPTREEPAGHQGRYSVCRCLLIGHTAASSGNAWATHRLLLQVLTNGPDGAVSASGRQCRHSSALQPRLWNTYDRVAAVFMVILGSFRQTFYVKQRLDLRFICILR